MKSALPGPQDRHCKGTHERAENDGCHARCFRDDSSTAPVPYGAALLGAKSTSIALPKTYLHLAAGVVSALGSAMLAGLGAAGASDLLGGREASENPTPFCCNSRY